MKNFITWWETKKENWKIVNKVVDRKIINKVVNKKIVNQKYFNSIKILKRKINALYVRL